MLLPLLLLAGVGATVLWVAKRPARLTERLLPNLFPYPPLENPWFRSRNLPLFTEAAVDAAANTPAAPLMFPPGWTAEVIRVLQAQLAVRGFYRGLPDGRPSPELAAEYMRWLNQPNARWMPHPPRTLRDALYALQREAIEQVSKPPEGQVT
jgi:hypothetical protein